MGQQSWDAAKEACWKQDTMPELHNNDALWAFLMRVPEEMRMMDRSCLNNQTLWRLLDMGIFDWEGTDKLMNQAQQATTGGRGGLTQQAHCEFFESF